MAAEFEFVFVSMGQGDCCLVKCPNGAVVMVDCGSSNDTQSRGETWAAIDLLRTPQWCGGRGYMLDALILTHPDLDHYNWATQFIAKNKLDRTITLPDGTVFPRNKVFRKLSIQNVYFSKAGGDNSPLRAYKATGFNNAIYGHDMGTPDLTEVTIDKPNQVDLNKWFPNQNYRGSWPSTAPDQELTILDGTKDGDNWSISIIAGNVQGGTSSVAKNSASLVTVFKVGNRKALSFGDANDYTAQFLITNRTAQIRNASLATVPHHGSLDCSPRKLVKRVKATNILVSVAYFEHKHFLPAEVPVERWLKHVSGQTIAHHIVDYWVDKVNGTALDRDYFDKKKRTWGTKAEADGNFIWLKRPANGVWAVKILAGSVRALFRENIDLSILETSQKTQVYKMTNAGLTNQVGGLWQNLP